MWKKVFTKQNLFFIIASVIMCLLTIILYFNRVVYPNNQNKKYQKELEEEQQAIISGIEQENSKMNKIERDIPKTDDEKVYRYVGEYMGLVNRKEYLLAYEKLNSEFKNNNFIELEYYIDYCEKKYQTYRQVEVLQYKKVDNIFVVETQLTRLVEKNDDLDVILQYFTIREVDDLGNFEISFGMGDN